MTLQINKYRVTTINEDAGFNCQCDDFCSSECEELASEIRENNWNAVQNVGGFNDYCLNRGDTGFFTILLTQNDDISELVENNVLGTATDVYCVDTCDNSFNADQKAKLEEIADFTHYDANETFYCFHSRPKYLQQRIAKI